MVLVFVHKVLVVFGIDFDYEYISNTVVDIVESLFLILGFLGITVDPTTKGLGDSSRAMEYNEPNADDE